MQIFAVKGIWDYAQFFAVDVLYCTVASAYAEHLDAKCYRVVEHGGDGGEHREDSGC